MGVALVLAGVAVVKAVPEAPVVLRAQEQPAALDDGWGPTYVDPQGRPARWDPCAPIGVVVNPAGMPRTAPADLAEALRRLGAASGLELVLEGESDEVPGSRRPAYQPERYGDRWAPVLVGWVQPEQTDLLDGEGVLGVTVATALGSRDGGSILTAQVAMNASRPLVDGFGPGLTQGEVLLHELAHAIGLGHVDDPGQVMYPQSTNGRSDFGAGDRAGLAALGSAAGCHPAPRARPLRVGVEGGGS